jgi:hypothetical protein
MPKKILGCAILILLLGLAKAATASPVCPMKTKAPWDTRIFANSGDQNEWREYRTLDDAPALKVKGDMLAEFWQVNKNARSAYLVERGQDFKISTRYCFDESGNLEGIGFEVETALGWGHRMEGPVSGGAFSASTSEFFNVETGKTLHTPGGVNSMPSALQPVLYMNQNELPFASLLTVTTKPAKKHGRNQGTQNATETLAESHRAPTGN